MSGGGQAGSLTQAGLQRLGGDRVCAGRRSTPSRTCRPRTPSSASHRTESCSATGTASKTGSPRSVTALTSPGLGVGRSCSPPNSTPACSYAKPTYPRSPSPGSTAAPSATSSRRGWTTPASPADRFFPAQSPRRPRFPPLHDGIPSTSLSIAASTSPTAIVTARQDRHHPSRPDDLAALQPTNPRRRRRQRGRSADHTTFQHAGVLNAAAVTPMEVPLTTGQGITTSNQTLTLAGPQRPGDIALHRP